MRSRRISCWTVTSRAVVGSSAISNSGSAAIAAAIITLLLPARELVRVPAKERSRIRQMHLLEQFHHLVGDGSSADVGVQPDRLRDLTAGAHHRVQRPSGVLEDEADPLAADLRELAVSQSDEVPAVEPHRPGYLRLVGQEAGDGLGGHRLARSGLADQPQPRRVAGQLVDVDDLVVADVNTKVADLEHQESPVQPARDRGPCAARRRGG